MYEIRKYMNKKIQFIGKNESVAQAARIMRVNNASCLVVKENEKYLGILTEKDIIYKAIAEHLEIATTVEEVMTFPLVTAMADEDVISVANMMQKKKIKKLPVQEKNKIIGIVTDSEMVSALLEIINESTNLKKDIAVGSKINKSLSLIKNFNKDTENNRVWHMICSGCKNRFFVDEKKGKIESTKCPKCQSNKTNFVA